MEHIKQRFSALIENKTGIEQQHHVPKMAGRRMLNVFDGVLQRFGHVNVIVSPIWLPHFQHPTSSNHLLFLLIHSNRVELIRAFFTLAFETFNKVLMKSNFEIKLSLNIQLFLIFYYYYYYYYCSTCSLAQRIFGRIATCILHIYVVLNACIHFMWWGNA